MRAMAALFVGICMSLAGARASGEWGKYEAGSYTIYTDLGEEQAREARVRMQRLGEEFRKQLAGVMESPRQRLPFYLYREESDYVAAGGRAGTGGVFTGGELMAVAGEKANLQTWQIVQHEAFHQFAHAAAGEKLPPWLDEGLAEYFGESLFAGDGYVSGLLPTWRVARVKRATIDWKKLMSMGRDSWAKKIEQANYDAAWAMVSYLMKERETEFRDFVKEVAAGRKWEEVWNEKLADSQSQCGRWLANLGENPTRELYANVVEQTVDAFLKREKAFASVEQLQRAVSKWRLEKEQWLPPGLLDEAIELGKKMGDLKIDNGRAVLRPQP